MAVESRVLVGGGRWCCRRKVVRGVAGEVVMDVLKLDRMDLCMVINLSFPRGLHLLTDYYLYLQYVANLELFYSTIMSVPQIDMHIRTVAKCIHRKRYGTYSYTIPTNHPPTTI
jgi:hypothetical protein